MTARDCFIITLTFHRDLSIVSENSVNYLEINVNTGGSGPDIPGPIQSDTETTTYAFDGNVLTFVDAKPQRVNVDVTVTGNTMTVDAADPDIPNFNAGGELIFRKR
ncbi:MAG TPA: hypothetical protein VKN36_03825 [Eudoraea sp.]|nr:hypothetical protein [Eudoraea sp.]